MVQHFEIAADLRIFVAQGIETMRALRDDFRHAIFAQGLDVLLRKRLEEVFVPQPAGRVAVTRLFLAENAERHAGLPQYLDQCARDFLLPLVERSRAADEE